MSTRNRRLGSPSGFSLRIILKPLGVLLVLVGTFLGARFGWQSIQMSQRLQVKEIQIVGNERVSDADIKAYTGIELGDPILEVSLGAVSQRIEQHPWVERALVQRSLPNRIRIEIQEQVPKILVSLGDVYIANAEGFLFKRLSAQDKLVLPVLTGLHREDVEQNLESTQKKIREAIALLQEFEAQTKRIAIDEIAWEEELGFSVMTSESEKNVRVQLGFQPYDRLKLGLSARAQLIALGKIPEIIWADGLHTDSVHAKLRDAQSGREHGAAQ